MTIALNSNLFAGDAGIDRNRIAAGGEPFDPIEWLRARRNEIAHHLIALAAEEPTAPLQWSNHLADHAQDHEQWQNRAALRVILTAESHEVEHALRRVEMGAYGRCEECGQEIPPRRLHAMPAAVVCVTCQGRRETREGNQ